MPPPQVITPVPHNVNVPNISQTQILELNGNNLGAPPILAPKSKQPPLSETLDNTKKDEISFSKNGGGGAVLIEPKDTTMTGSAIKVEQLGDCKAAQKCSQMMENFFEHAQGPQPFVAPRITVLTGEQLRKDPDLLQQINDAHSEAFSKAPSNRAYQVKEAGERLKYLEDPNHFDEAQQTKVQYGVSTMEFAKGVQLNDLPLNEKLALVKGEGFARTMGRSMAPLMSMGMNDHMGGGQVSFATNPTNFMYDTKSGQLSVIDYSSDKQVNGKDFDNPQIGQKGASRGLKEVAETIANGVESQDAFDETLYQMTGGQGASNKQNALTRAVDPFLQAGDDSLFKKSENPTTKVGTRIGKTSGKIFDVNAGPVDLAITQEDRERFAVNMMAGILDGIEYMQKNEQAFRNAVQSTQETVNGQTLQHIHTDQELDELCTELQSIDVKTLRQNLGERVKGMENRFDVQRDVKLAQLGNEAKAITDRMNKVQKNIERIENHPTFADKMKKFATGKGEHPLDKYRAELATLQQDGAKIQAESAVLINKKVFHAELKNQAEHPPTQQTQQQTTHHTVRQDIGKEEEKQGVSQTTKVKVGKGKERDVDVQKVDVGVQDLDVPRDMPKVPDVPTRTPKVPKGLNLPQVPDVPNSSTPKVPQHVPTRDKLQTGTQRAGKGESVTQHGHGV